MPCDKGWGVIDISKFQLSSSYRFCVMRFEGIEEMDDSLTESMSNKGDCRTAPAKPGLLNTKILMYVLWSYS